MTNITMIVNLTPRESMIADCVSRGMTTMQIAATLGISFHTVEAHIYNIRIKTQTTGRNRVALADTVRRCCVPQN